MPSRNKDRRRRRVRQEARGQAPIHIPSKESINNLMPEGDWGKLTRRLKRGGGRNHSPNSLNQRRGRPITPTHHDLEAM